MKRLLALLLLLSLSLAAQIINHNIKIDLHDDGSAYVEQEYLTRIAAEDKADFDALLKNGATIDQLQKYGIGKVITYQSENENVIIELTQSDFAIVVLQYRIADIVEAVEKVGKQELTGITEQAFTFYDSTTISLPYDPPTTLTISVPATIKIAREVTPPAYSTTAGYNNNGEQITTYEWNYRRPFTSNKFQVLYEKELPLQSQLSLSAITQDFRSKYGNPIYMIAGIILTAILFVYRKELSSLLSESFNGEIDVDEEDELD